MGASGPAFDRRGSLYRHLEPLDLKSATSPNEHELESTILIVAQLQHQLIGDLGMLIDVEMCLPHYISTQINTLSTVMLLPVRLPEENP